MEREEILTPEDLKRVFIRAQDEQGHWKSINCYESTDTQFDTWAKSRIEIQGEGTWSLNERADFCDHLYQMGALHVIKKDVTFDEEE